MNNNLPLFNQIEDDELFTRPPRSARRQTPQLPTARRQCDACQVSYTVSIDYDGLPLCDGCRVDTDATRGRVQAWINGVTDQLDAAGEAWLAFAAEHADAWDKILVAKKQPDFDQRAAAHRAKGNIYGQLLDAEEAYTQDLARLGAEKARLERALEVLDGQT